MLSQLLFITLASLMPLASPHGLVTYPPMRTAFTPFFGPTDCPYCLNAGGTNTQSGGRTIRYREGFPSPALHEVCGDPVGVRRNMDGTFPITSVDVSSGTMTVDFVITTNHWGKLCYRVFTNPADVAAGNEDAATDNLLQRADGRGSCVFPPMADREDGDGMKYMGEATSQDWLGSWGAKYRSVFKWPGFQCKGYCVLHMHWTTGHSCTPEGVPSSSVKSYGGFPAVPCTGDGSPFPENFWNCANFIPVNGGGSRPASSNATTTSDVAVVSTTSIAVKSNNGTSAAAPAQTPSVSADSAPSTPSAPPSSSSDMAQQCQSSVLDKRGGGSLQAWEQCGDQGNMPYSDRACAAGMCVKMTDTFAKCVPLDKPQEAQGGSLLYCVQ